MKNKKTLLERASYTWSEDSVRMILTPGSTARAVYLYAQEIGCFKTVHPYFTERQNLDSFLILYTLSGRGFLEYGGCSYELEKGQCAWIYCENHHLYYTKEGEEWEFLWVHFHGSSALGYYQEFIKNGFGIVTDPAGGELEETLRALLRQYQTKNMTTDNIASNQLNQLLTNLLLHTVQIEGSKAVMPGYIQDMIRDIDKNFRDTRSLSYFEETYHRSRFHLLKEFKKYTGITINEYVILERISHAKELLKYTDLPVSEVSEASGIGNATHFINLFKTREGLTPLAYRKAWRE